MACVKHYEKRSISQYRTIDPDTSEEIFWYLISDTDSGSVSYITTSRPVTSFTNVVWNNSQTKPTELENVTPEETIEADVDVDAVEADATDATTDNDATSDSNDTSDAGSDSGGDGGGDGGE